jgi:hypothetical protein
MPTDVDILCLICGLRLDGGPEDILGGFHLDNEVDSIVFRIATDLPSLAGDDIRRIIVDVLELLVASCDTAYH